jgi:hypothetical protein
VFERKPMPKKAKPEPDTAESGDADSAE